MQSIIIRMWGCLLALLLGVPAVRAADYPERPVTLVTAFTPGGPSDLLGRIVGQKISEILHQPFVIDGRPGGGGNIAAEFVAHAMPDGYTLLLGNNSILATNMSLYKRLAYDARRDFAPISLIGSQANILVVGPKLQVNSMAELIAFAKANPGKLNYASTGYGAAAHLSAELFKKQAGVDIVMVPYKGSAPALQDLIGGRIDMVFATAASVIGYVRSGTLRPLAVTTSKRTSLLPDVATVAELGLPDFEATTWHGLVAPASTPRDIIDTLDRATIEALKDPGVRKSLMDLGVEINSGSPEEFAAYIKSEIPKWAAVIEASGAKAD
ncbi:MAG: tripartite tricarboxylate transporter substrate binding protein [Bradyrhizobiaceae bacterium]|nr:tripartite tricarboxylate transporter substrate binding protein [Bradyrhizobiaceae bacterium]